jgi:hypothetical protein
MFCRLIDTRVCVRAVVERVITYSGFDPEFAIGQYYSDGDLQACCRCDNE